MLAVMQIGKAGFKLTFTCIHAGYSFGGVVAFESAHHLREEGKDVKGLILIDSPYPVNHEPLPDEVIAHVSKSGSPNNANNSTRQRVAKQFQANAAMLGKYTAPRSSQAFPRSPCCAAAIPLIVKASVAFSTLGSATSKRDHNLLQPGRS